MIIAYIPLLWSFRKELNLKDSSNVEIVDAIQHTINQKNMKKLAKQLINTGKSKLKERSVKNKLTRVLNNQIDGGTIVGEKNYNTHAKTIRMMVKDNNLIGANEYVDRQQRKLAAQKEVVRVQKKKQRGF